MGKYVMERLFKVFNIAGMAFIFVGGHTGYISGKWHNEDHCKSVCDRRKQHRSHFDQFFQIPVHIRIMHGICDQKSQNCRYQCTTSCNQETVL